MLSVFLRSNIQNLDNLAQIFPYNSINISKLLDFIFLENIV